MCQPPYLLNFTRMLYLCYQAILSEQELHTSDIDSPKGTEDGNDGPDRVLHLAALVEELSLLDASCLL